MESIEYSVSSISMWTLSMPNNDSLIRFLGKDRKSSLNRKMQFFLNILQNRAYIKKILQIRNIRIPGWLSQLSM